MARKNNPIVERIDGIDIRESNNLTLTLNRYEYSRLVKVFIATGKTISMAKIIAILSKPCENCGHDCSTLSIPKGLFSTNKLSTGKNISSHKKIS